MYIYIYVCVYITDVYIYIYIYIHTYIYIYICVCLCLCLCVYVCMLDIIRWIFTSKFDRVLRKSYRAGLHLLKQIINGFYCCICFIVFQT